jgi:vancomycin resistance protein YoaR
LSQQPRRRRSQASGNYSPYPDDAWQTPVQQQAQTLQRHAAYPDDFAYETYRLAEAQWVQNHYRRQNDNRQDAYIVNSRLGHSSAGWAAAIFVCIAILAFMVYAVSDAYKLYPAFQSNMKMLETNTFFSGIYVDNLDIGGHTVDEAKAALSQSAAYTDQQFSITVSVDGFFWKITQNELPLKRNVDEVLKEAYAIGRQNTNIPGNGTPFESRIQTIRMLQNTPAALYTKITYDKSTIHQLADIIAAQVNRDPIDAMIATFDFNTKSFTFTHDSPGAFINSSDLYQAVTSQLDAGNYNASISLSSQILTPNVTSAALMSNFSMISSFTTTTNSNENRNTNINLAARSISGTTVLPGETFSFNKATGERTVAKGYLPAPAIADGTTRDDIGGGVCQLSGTLFNAVALADLEIVYRSPHAWPSDYVEKGRDATVDWPSLDFKFKNNKDTPIFIVASYHKKKVTVELYGMSLGRGISVDIQTKLVSTTEPPSESIYQQNPELQPGTEQVLKKARKGYVVETYRIYKRDGAEYDRKLLFTSTYKMIQEVIEYN